MLGQKPPVVRRTARRDGAYLHSKHWSIFESLIHEGMRHNTLDTPQGNCFQMKKSNSIRLNKQATVLIVDSAPESRNELAHAFLQYGLKVLVVGTGGEAMDIIRWMRSPVLAIIDMILPDMSGLELATRLKRERAIPLLITGYQDEPSVIAGLLDLIADDFIRKPFDVRELAARGYRLIQSVERISAAQKYKGSKKAVQPSFSTVPSKLVH